VLIDGGLLGSFKSANLARARSELADIRSGNVFLDILGLGLPEINGIFTEVGALWRTRGPMIRRFSSSTRCSPTS
jgi:hypothetical protein